MAPPGDAPNGDVTATAVAAPSGDAPNGEVPTAVGPDPSSTESGGFKKRPTEGLDYDDLSAPPVRPLPVESLRSLKVKPRRQALPADEVEPFLLDGPLDSMVADEQGDTSQHEEEPVAENPEQSESGRNPAPAVVNDVSEDSASSTPTETLPTEEEQGSDPVAALDG